MLPYSRRSDPYIVELWIGLRGSRQRGCVKVNNYMLSYLPCTMWRCITRADYGVVRLDQTRILKSELVAVSNGLDVVLSAV